MAQSDHEHFTLWNLGPQQLLVDFQGGRLVADAGLLATTDAGRVKMPAVAQVVKLGLQPQGLRLRQELMNNGVTGLSQALDDGRPVRAFKAGHA